MKSADLDDDELLSDDDEVVGADASSAPESLPPGTRRKWCVLVVDDDRDVRTITQLALAGARIDGAEIELVCVDGAAAARAFLKERSGVAVAVVDVVMESETAGLELVEWVRNELRDTTMRLVVRTGQPGSAPESQVMNAYDIHDYLSKADTTARRLVSCVTGAVRAFRDLRGIQQQREGLQRVLRAIDGLFRVVELDGLFREILGEISALQVPHARGAALIGPAGILRDDAAADQPRILAATGSYASLAGQDASALHLTDGEPLALDDLPGGKVEVRGGAMVYAFDLDLAVRPVLVCAIDDIEPWGRELTALYAHAVTLALRNRLLWEETVAHISKSLAEREILLKEIHHRVKNNLQIVSSLLSMQASKDMSEEARMAIIDSELRVRSISLVHHLLYGSQDFLHIDIGAAARALARVITGSISADAEIEVHAPSVELAVDQAIPCCLIINELITNSIKHGRSPDGRCRIRVDLAVTGDTVEVVLSDQGPGLPSDFASRRRSSLGVSIIEGLVQQLRGTMSSESGAGAHFVITFPRKGAA